MLRKIMILLIFFILIGCVPSEYKRPVQPMVQPMPTKIVVVPKGNIAGVVDIIAEDYYDTEKFCGCRDACMYECGTQNDNAVKWEEIRNNVCKCSCSRGDLLWEAPISNC